jgi:Ca2+-binding RTX toxin-like protein
MPRLTENLNETWHIKNLDYNRWEMTAGVTIDPIMGGSGIDDESTGSDIIVDGTVIARPFNASIDFAGIVVRDDASSVMIGDSGHIDAALVRFGILTTYGADVRNHGTIEALEAGIWGRQGANIENHGTIRAENGINLVEGNFNILNTGSVMGTAFGIEVQAGDFSVLANDAHATIRGEDGGLFISGDPGDVVKIVNEGLIKGRDFALDSAVATIELFNRGAMVGDILTGDGADTINTREGIIRGKLSGGEGNDTYVIGRSKVSIVEEDRGVDNDLVQSTFTYRLTDNIEALQLKGRKDINATGNNGDNILTGNIGKNTLSGGDGADTLYSRQGDDHMIGGAGADVFVFGEDYDRDRITDFQDGTDWLHLLGVTDQQGFDALNIRQFGDDLIINYSRGDQLIIENLRKQDLTLDDLMIT